MRLNVSVLNVYAMTEEKTEDKKDEFCEKLEQAYSKLNKDNIRILIGYVNTEIERKHM